MQFLEYIMATVGQPQLGMGGPTALACPPPAPPHPVYASPFLFPTPQSTLKEATAAVHSQLHLSEPRMYLFDLESNPSESIVDGCGTDKTLGPPAACGNLYAIPAFRDIRRKLEGIITLVEHESAAPTLRWMDDGPLADPASFGGWIPWRDSNGDPLASYEGVAIEDLVAQREPSQAQRDQVVTLTKIGAGGSEGTDEVETYSKLVTAAHASRTAIIAAIILICGTFVGYRAGQRSEYHLLR